ncbi:MAG: ABC transporter ATP-binding protein [Planctomycetota bacterium]
MANMIEVENLGKRYRLGGQDRYYSTLREAVVRSLTGFGRGRREKDEEFWALRNVSLAVGRGEVVGVIGKNGAGKSTLLKILSRVTRPTEGAARLHGRVGSLLEVGTGFHPELTGRENVFLTGNILGMSRAAVRERFASIAAFAEIERFLDTPVKHYSSGMYVRLGFAVAAHLEPEILLVDEVLAVGDAAFQKKCLGKMNDVSASHGRTVLFVSHNMPAVQSLCRRCILLDQGGVAADGPTDEVIDRYLRQGVSSAGSAYERPGDAATGAAYLRTARVSDREGRTIGTARLAEPFAVRMGWVLEKNVPDLRLSLRINNERGVTIFSSSIHDRDVFVEKQGAYHVLCGIDPNLLVPGRYTVDAFAFIPNRGYLDSQEGVLAFDVSSTEADGVPRFTPGRRGLIYYRPLWSAERIEGGEA